MTDILGFVPSRPKDFFRVKFLCRILQQSFRWDYKLNSHMCMPTVIHVLNDHIYIYMHVVNHLLNGCMLYACCTNVHIICDHFACVSLYAYTCGNSKWYSPCHFVWVWLIMQTPNCPPAVTQHAQNVRLRVWWIMQTPKQPSMQKNCQPQSLVDYANTQVIQHAQKVSDSQFGGLCKQPSNPAWTKRCLFSK